MRRVLLVAGFVVALWAAPGALASGWCGSGENPADLPDANTGKQVHMIYVIPSDGTDRFAQVANQMADDAASIDTWWATQDPTRILRFDTAQFPSCVAVDISFLRLSESAASVGNDANAAFDNLYGAVSSAGVVVRDNIVNPDKISLVYYDGPQVQQNICGTGSSSAALAIVWLAGCANAPTDAIATHEVLHALGALPAGAPHACGPDQGGAGHPCDNPLDVLYPYTMGAPLSAQYLDWNHDDYYGHSGSWLDIQDSLFLHRLDLPQEPLAITIQGAGTIRSDEPGVVCTATCTTQWDQGSQVSIAPVPTDTSRFVRWTGACQGQGTCFLTMSQAQSATALFGPQTIAVKTSVSGSGRIACTPVCSATFTAGNGLTVRPVAAKGWRFTGWSGACTGKALVCRPTTDFALAIHAKFAKIPVKAKPKKPKKR